MNSKAMTLSLIMAGVAVYFVMSSVSSIEESAKTKFGNDVTIFVAKVDIKEMDTIREDFIEPQIVPKNFVGPSDIAFNTVVDDKSPDYGIELKQIVGNVAIVPIKKGEHIALNKITEPSIRTGLASQVTPGKRAISISVDETSSVSKLIKPGDRVDIIAVMDAGSTIGRDNKIAKTVFQDVVILAVGRSITNNIARKIEPDIATGRPRIKSLTDFDGYSSVTLELDPTQAQSLAALSATNGTKIIFTLRNNDDSDRSNLNAVRPSDVLWDGRLPAQVPGQLPASGGPR